MAKTQQNIRNIIVGAAAVYISKADSSTWAAPIALPSLTAGTTARTTLDGASTDWRDVGYTMEGVEVAYEPDYGEIEVDQLLDSAKLFKQSMRVTLNSSFAEATLENLLVVWGQRSASYAPGATATDDDVLSMEAGSLGEFPYERSIAFVGPAPHKENAGANVPRERIYHVGRVLQTESSSHALRRNEATGLPVSFRVLPSTNTSVAQYGTIRDRRIS